MSKYLIESSLQNPDVYMDEITMEYISGNPNITPTIMKNSHPYTKWSWFELSKNMLVVTHDFILTNTDEYINKNLNWYCISMREDITYDFIKSNPHLPWNWYGVSRNPNITLKIILDSKIDICILNHINRKQNVPLWSMNDILLNKKFVNENLEFIWNYIINNIDSPWEWYIIFSIKTFI